MYWSADQRAKRVSVKQWKDECFKITLSSRILRKRRGPRNQANLGNPTSLESQENQATMVKMKVCTNGEQMKCRNVTYHHRVKAANLENLENLEMEVSISQQITLTLTSPKGGSLKSLAWEERDSVWTLMRSNAFSDVRQIILFGRSSNGT